MLRHIKTFSYVYFVRRTQRLKSPSLLMLLLIAVDGRALGVPPFGKYNQPYTVKSWGMQIELYYKHNHKDLL